MTRYLISFGANAMDHIPEEDMPTVAKAAHAVVQEALNVGVYVLGHRRTHGRRGALTRGCAAMGCQDRCGLPLCPRGPGVRARSRPRRDPPPGSNSLKSDPEMPNIVPNNSISVSSTVRSWTREGRRRRFCGPCPLGRAF